MTTPRTEALGRASREPSIVEIDGFRGRLIRAGSPDYDTARAVWNGAIDRRPRLIARCIGVADVIAAINATDIAVEARVDDSGSGILLYDTGGGTSTLKVEELADGTTAADLGLTKPVKTITIDGDQVQAIDGAGTWGRFRHVTLPLLMPVILIVTTFSIIITFFDFQLVYVLTGGGPANATHLMATYAYSISMGGGQLGLGSAAALAMVPVLGAELILMSSYVRRS